MCMLLHRYTVFVILFANGIPFHNSGLVFDHIYLLVSMICFQTLHHRSYLQTVVTWCDLTSCIYGAVLT